MDKFRKILVTGGAGYIGSHTVVDLFKNGYQPIIVDNLSNSTTKNLDGINKILKTKIKWYNIDCTDYNSLINVFSKEKNISGCIHFAAFKSVDESIFFPKKYFYNNVKSLEVLMQCMSEKSINKLIFSSSCTVYGMPDKLPVLELSPFKDPESPYSETKQICEKLLSKDKIDSISLRYFNPIGTHESLLIGDCSNDKCSNLVPIIAEVAQGIRKKLIINGNDYQTYDGTCVRDYIHVEDLAHAHVLSLNYLFSNKKYKQSVFNVGSGKGLSVLDVVNSFEKINNIKINFAFGKRRSGDIEKIYANCDLINKEINWKPKKTLNQALKSAFKWQK